MKHKEELPIIKRKRFQPENDLAIQILEDYQKQMIKVFDTIPVNGRENPDSTIIYMNIQKLHKSIKTLKSI